MDSPSQPGAFRRRREFLTGARDIVPLLLGAAPFGLIYGTMATAAGLSAAAAMAMSLIVFAGSAQFVAVGLVAVGTPALIVIATTFIVNLRHMLYSVTLLPYLKRLPQRWLIPLAFLLTDETFAVTVHRVQKEDASPYKHWYQFGSSVVMYLNWQIWCLLGLVLGDRIPDLASWGLDVAMPIAFIGMTVPFVRNMPMVACVSTAGVCGLYTVGLPYKLGIIVSALAGVLAGLLAEAAVRRRRGVALR